MNKPILEANNFSGWDADKNGKRWEDYDTIVCPDGQVINMVKLLDDQQRAKAALTHILPWMGGLINKLRPIYTFRIETQATDGYNLLINPQFTYNLDLTGKVFVMAHEIMHCLLNHMRRGKSHDHNRSNVAADYEVNATLVDLGLVKDSHIQKLDALLDHKYDGWGYEKIYDEASIPNQSGNQNNQNQAKQAQNNQQNNDNGSGDNQQAYSDEYKKGWAQAIEDYKSGKLKI